MRAGNYAAPSQARELMVRAERWPLRRPMQITGRAFTEVGVIAVSLRRGDAVGRGEAAGVYYRDQTPESMCADIERLAAEVTNPGFTRLDLQSLLPPGGARNALDCAMWELEARECGQPVWELAGLAHPGPLITTVTVGADEPSIVFERINELPWAQAIKLKLRGDDADVARVQAARRARPAVWLSVDANEAYTAKEFDRVLPYFAAARVSLIEQPLPAGQDEALRNISSSIPLVADESIQCHGDLERACGKYQMVNIKLDKCGGLSEALRMARKARACNLGLMVGNMGGTSLGMAPAWMLGQLCDVVDLDGPLLLARDRDPAMSYRKGLIDTGELNWGRAS